jgi:hypothetical protein
MEKKASPEKAVREIRRKMRRRFSAEEKIRSVIEDLRGEESIASLCRREGIAKIALPERGVTRNSGHIGNTSWPLQGRAKCRGRSVARWMSVSGSWPDFSMVRKRQRFAESSISRGKPATRSSIATRKADARAASMVHYCRPIQTIIDLGAMMEVHIPSPT